MVSWTASVVLAILQILIAVGLLYYYSLLVGSVRRRADAEPGCSRGRLFAIAIPAHNEAAVLEETLGSLRQLDYPPHLFDVFVAADHCDDATAEVARGGGAICYEREGGLRGRKAYALQWLFDRILGGNTQYDALIVFDADSQVDGGFLRAMDRALCSERPVLQGRHVVATPEGSGFSGVAAVDMRLNNLLRNQAKENLGLSCRLMGDGMCFDTQVIRRYGWPADSLGEDREYGLYLLLQGIRVSYAPEAMSVGQAAPSWRAASAQRLRWYGGVLEIRRKLAPKLLGLGLQKGDWAALDKGLELLLPPFSFLALLSVCVAVIQGLWPTTQALLPLPVTVSLVLAWGIFPFLALWIDRAPAVCYRALLYSPLYLLWRVGVGLRANVLGKRVQWVRTRRHQETGAARRE